MINLPGYQLKTNLYQGTRTLVYRGTRNRDHQPVIIKVLRNEYPTFNELLQFRNQYTIAKNLEQPGIIQTYNLEVYRNGYALVMEDFGGVSLAEFAQGKSLEIQIFLLIAIQLADILHKLYKNRVIHKDIKPANILIHPETQEVKLIDFSISSLLPRETQEIQNPNILEGTLAYISPEQTGRMNRGIDYRTDFYSLGVTFYELISGKLPFFSDDPMELVHCHIAKTPPTLKKHQNIPQILSDIVFKLMAKNAEDRYQSAFGLKYDLEQCFQQLETSREITSFELGKRDLCDRFMIPEKLYGRETEVQTLLNAFERVANLPLNKRGGSEMMLVAGFSGIGKTAVVNEVHKPIVRQRGYFIKGKYDQFNRNIPFSAFVQAFRDLMGQILSESDTQLENWKSKILEAVGENGQILIDVIPELENIIGQQPQSPELTGSAAQNRFNLLFSKFVRVFTTKEHPLVIFLDDLQWADSASLNLLKLLMDGSKTGYLLVLGAYRDNEVNPAHPLMLSLNELRKRCDPAAFQAAKEARTPVLGSPQVEEVRKRRAPRENQAIINTITLESLTFKQINQLISETLMCGEELAQPLSKLVNQKTQGNPFFTTQFLKGLHEDKLITFNPSLGYWECDLSQVRDAALTSDVVEFMAGQLHKLSEETQQVLKLAACIGNQFDLETLAIVCEESQEEVATDIWEALQEGLILPISEAYKFFQGSLEESIPNVTVSYRFLHDRVQQAAYSLIPETQRQKTHLKIGQLLLTNIPEDEQGDRIFEMVNHWNEAIDLIVDDEDQKMVLVHLNIKAGKKAKLTIAYESAICYLKTSIFLLPETIWKTHYNLALQFYNLATEVAYLSGDFSQMDQWLSIIFEQSKTILDKISAYQTQILAYTAQTQQQEVIQLSLKVLQELGINCSVHPSKTEVEAAFEVTQSQLKNYGFEAIAHLPEMQDKKWLAAIQILQASVPTIYQINADLFQVMVFKLIDLSCQYGNTPFSSFGYACYGLLLCERGQIEEGKEAGSLALILAEKFEDLSIKARTLFCVCLYVEVWEKHLDHVMNSLQKVYSLGLEQGEIEFTGYAVFNYSCCAYLSGKNLSLLQTEITNFLEVLKKLKQESTETWVKFYLESICALLQESHYSVSDYQSKFDQLLKCLQRNDFHGLFHADLNQAIFYYFLEETQDSQQLLKKAENHLNTVTGSVLVAAFVFYDSLVKLKLYTSEDLSRNSVILDQLEIHQSRMRNWALHAPNNFQHKYDLVEAEKCRVLDQKLEAIEFYDKAIAGAKENEYLQEEALANELAAKFYLDWGKEKVAAGYMQEAYYCYARWGAKAKIEDLKKRYPQLLSPILKTTKYPLDPHKTITLMQNETVHSLSSTTIASIFDFATVIKASQALSSEIELDQLLSKLMKVVIENAGADRGVLILRQQEKWMIAVRCDDGEICQIQSTPLNENSEVSLHIINTVKRNFKVFVSDDISKESFWDHDPYLLRQHPQSVLCSPILNQGKLIGIVYLENHLIIGAFTPDRVEVLNLLCSQAAISLENARLYQEAQQALEDLQQAQIQIIQSEKMSALGNVVAGVAHEINNPTSFLQGNIKPAQDYIQDLFGLIDLYQSEYPQPSEAIREEIEEIDLEFICEDLPKLIGSMNLGVERIRNISKSLRIFSREDQEQKTILNIHDGIDSTLLILKHRTNKTPERAAIQIIKYYTNLPQVQCFPGQLNQVFMNILANAIDAFDQALMNLNPAERKNKKHQIKIQTAVVNKNQIEIKIEDNGCGMKPETKNRIFEQGFTTKGVGKGTGLGMAIAHQIITEKHDGTIRCDSQLGKGTIFTIRLPIT